MPGWVGRVRSSAAPCHVIDVVDLGEVADLLVAQVLQRRQEASVPGLLRQPLETLSEAVLVLSKDRPHQDAGAVAEDELLRAGQLGARPHGQARSCHLRSCRDVPARSRPWRPVLVHVRIVAGPRRRRRWVDGPPPDEGSDVLRRSLPASGRSRRGVFGTTGSLEQPAGRCRIPPRGYEHIDDLAKLVDRTRHRATGRRPPPTSGPPASGPNATLARAGGVSRQRRERGTQRSTVTWSASMPRSASSSSTSRYDRPKRRYQRTAGTIRSRPVEAKAGNGRAGDGGGRGRWARAAGCHGGSLAARTRSQRIQACP